MKTKPNDSRHILSWLNNIFKHNPNNNQDKSVNKICLEIEGNLLEFDILQNQNDIITFKNDILSGTYYNENDNHYLNLFLDEHEIYKSIKNHSYDGDLVFTGIYRELVDQTYIPKIKTIVYKLL